MKSYKSRRAVGPKKSAFVGPIGGPVQIPKGKITFSPAYVERKANDWLKNKTEEEALRFNRKLAGVATKVLGRGEAEVEMVPNTFDGSQGSGAESVPSFYTKSIKRNSGGNGTYNSKVHKLKFVAGDPPSRALARLHKDNGTLTKRILKTLNDVSDNTSRQALSISNGFNQKNVVYVHPGYFGFEYNGIWNNVLDYDTQTTPNDKIQRAYAAVSKLISKVTLTNNNVVLPINVCFKLIRQKAVGVRASDIGTNIINTSHTVQDAGKFPIHYQLRDFQSTTNMSYTAVDPTKSAIHGSMNALAFYEIVKSKTVKVAAGDHVEFLYEHNFKSGINMSKLLSAIIGSEPEDNSLYTYGLVVETWGPRVEALKLDGNGDPILPAVRINGTGPSNYTFEFEKYAVGAKATSSFNPDTTQTGLQAGPFATRVFTPEVLTGSETNKIIEFNYVLLNAANGFKVPLITDTTISDANRKL